MLGKGLPPDLDFIRLHMLLLQLLLLQPDILVGLHLLLYPGHVLGGGGGGRRHVLLLLLLHVHLM